MNLFSAWLYIHVIATLALVATKPNLVESLGIVLGFTLVFWAVTARSADGGTSPATAAATRTMFDLSLK